MANELNELSDETMEGGRDIKVIAKQLPVKIGVGSKIFDVIWWFLPPLIGGIVWAIIKANRRSYFKRLEQKLQHDASQIDNYLEQRVQILKNCAKLVDKAVNFDKDTFTTLAAYRGGTSPDAEAKRNEVAKSLSEIGRSINIAFENYPDLRAHQEIADAMQQNSYLQREITAAREVYNDTVNQWNGDIFAWPAKQIVAAKQGYTTRIPFILDEETKAAARGDFF